MPTDTFADPKPRIAGGERIPWSMYITAAAAGSTGVETALNTFVSSGLAVEVQAVSYTIPKGKRLRVTGVTMAARGHATATAQVTEFSLRTNSNGAVITTTTPLLLKGRAGTPATALAYDRDWLDLGEGFEIYGDGLRQIGWTANAVYTTNAPTWDLKMVGYLY